MSLVSEALKKAEREAAAREARERGQSPAPFESPLQPYRAGAGGDRLARLRLWALLGGAAALALSFALWSNTRKAPVRGVPPVASLPSEALPVPAATGGPLAHPPASPSASEPLSHEPPEPARLPLPQAAFSPQPAPPSGSEPEAPAATTQPLPKATPGPQPTPPNASEPQSPALATNPQPGTTPGPQPVRPGASEPPAPAGAQLPPGEHLRRVDFADGTSLELGGIVYSESSPFAYLNGRLVGVGEFVLGRRIDRIEREKVVLSGDAGTLTLRLKAP